MPYPLLSHSLMKEILDYLACPVKAPTLQTLNRLIQAYLGKVPWESVSRIVKRHATKRTEDCPRWPEEFWRDAIQYGFGGTCYESSLAFFSLLMKLGYSGYLTVNDMGEHRGCHAAIVVVLKQQKYLVDITIPVHSAVRFDLQRATRRQTSFLDYTIRPVRKDIYEVKRSHPSKIAFTLVDVPVDLRDYCTIMENDYGATGLFLNRVVMVKFIRGKTLRFFSDHQPCKLESFNRACREETFINPEILPERLSGLFGMPEEQISIALTFIQVPPFESIGQHAILPAVPERQEQDENP